MDLFNKQALKELQAKYDRLERLYDECGNFLDEAKRVIKRLQDENAELTKLVDQATKPATRSRQLPPTEKRLRVRSGRVMRHVEPHLSLLVPGGSVLVPRLQDTGYHNIHSAIELALVRKFGEGVKSKITRKGDIFKVKVLANA